MFNRTQGKCIGSNLAEAICATQNCQNPSLICQTRSCKCQTNHNRCLIRPSLTLLMDKLFVKDSKRLNSFELLIGFCDRWMKQFLTQKQHLEKMMDQGGSLLEKNQRIFFQSLRKENTHKLTGDLMSQVVYSSQRDSRIDVRLVQGRIKKEIKKYQQILKTVMDQMTELVNFKQQKEQERQQRPIKRQKPIINNNNKIQKIGNQVVRLKYEQKEIEKYFASYSNRDRFRFSSIFKSQGIVLLNDRKIKGNQSRDGICHYVILEPALESIPQQQIMVKLFIQRNEWIQLGISDKNYLTNNQFVCYHDNQMQGIVVNQNGNIYSYVREEHGTKREKQFIGFKIDDTLCLIFNKNKGQLTIMNMTKNQQITLNASKMHQNQSLHFSIGLKNYLGKIPVIEILR